MKIPFFGKKDKKDRKNKKAGKNSLTRQTGENKPVVAEEKIKRPGRQARQGTAKPDEYYAKLSSVAQGWRYAVTVLLLVFGVGMAFVYSSEITAENFGLLLRNASFSFPGEDTNFDTVRYDADLKMDFAAYREYFAVASTTGFKMYNHRGNIVLSEDAQMSAPTVRAGENYVLVYDREGRSYMICNSVTTLKKEKPDHPIHDADMSDEGSYLFVTSSENYLSILQVYNRSFNLKRELQIDRYPIGAKLSPQADRMLFLSYKTSDSGALEGYVSFYDLSDKTEALADRVYGELPICGVMTDKGAAVVFPTRVVFYNRSGAETGVCPFQGKTPTRCAFGENDLVLVFETDKVRAKNEIRHIDLTLGEELRSFPFEGRIKGLWRAGAYLFIGEKERLHCYAATTMEEQIFDVELPFEVLAGRGKTLFFCYGSKAENVYASLTVPTKETAEGPTKETRTGPTAEPTTAPTASATTETLAEPSASGTENR